MKDRRAFLKTSMVVAAGAITSGVAPAMGTMAHKVMFPKGIIYTKEEPGRWAKKVGSHLPIVTVDGGKVTIETRHPMTERHYIVRHTLVSPDGTVLGEKTFYPTDKRAISEFEISGHHPLLYATSFCNKHDLWVAQFSV